MKSDRTRKIYSSVEWTKLPSSVTQGQIDILETENLKKYQRHMDNMMRDGPKFYSLIMEHRSAESIDTIKREVDYTV
jgi:hypothetical protein